MKTIRRFVALCMAALTLCLFCSAAAQQPDRAEALRRRNAKTMDSFVGMDIVVLEDGTVYSSLDRDPHSTVNEWTDIVSVSAAEGWCVGLRSDGTVVLCDREGGLPIQDWTDIVDVEANYWNNPLLAVTADGRVRMGMPPEVYGRLEEYDPPFWEEILDFTDVISVEAEAFGLAFLHEDGTVHAFSMNSPEVYEQTRQWTNIVQIAMSGNCIAGLRADGTVVQAGNRNQEQCRQLAEWSDVVYISISNYNIIGIRRDGTLLYLDEMIDSFRGTSLRSLEGLNIAAVSHGNAFAVTTDGQIVDLNCSLDVMLGLSFGEHTFIDGKRIRLPEYFF